MSRLGQWTHTVLISFALCGVLSSSQRSGSDYPHLSDGSLTSSAGSCFISGRFMSAVPGQWLQDYWVWPYSENSTCAFEPTCPTEEYKMLLHFQPSANLTVTVTSRADGVPLGETKPFVWSDAFNPTAVLFPHSAARVEFASTGSGKSSEAFSLICLRTPVDSAPVVPKLGGRSSYSFRGLLAMSSGAQGGSLSSSDAGGNVTRGWLFVCLSGMDLLLTLNGPPPREVDFGLVDGTTGVDIHPDVPALTHQAAFRGVAMLTAVFPAGYVDRSGFLVNASCLSRESPRPPTFPSRSAERKSKGAIVAAVVVPSLLLPAIVVGVVLCCRRFHGQRVRKQRQSQQQQHEGFAQELYDGPTSPSKARPSGNDPLKDPAPVKLVAGLSCVGCRVAAPSFALVGCGHVVVCACCASSMLGMPCPICGVVCLGIAPWIPSAGSWANPHPSPAVHSGIVVPDEPRTPYGDDQQREPRCDDGVASICPKN